MLNPGKQFEYSNMNYDIFRFDCSKASHQSYATYLSTHLFTPLHMTQSTVKGSNMKRTMMLQGYVIKEKLMLIVLYGNLIWEIISCLYDD